MATLIDTREFTAGCPNCGKRSTPKMSRRYMGKRIVSFYNCGCGFSTWDATEWNWCPADDHGPGCDGPLNCTCDEGLSAVREGIADRKEP